MENEKKRIKILAAAFIIIAVALVIQLAYKFATAEPFVICRDEGCDTFVEENTQIVVRHYEQDDGVVYVYVFEKGGER
jgi:hypothetical protein